jgi:hypothetical protein
MDMFDFCEYNGNLIVLLNKENRLLGDVIGFKALSKVSFLKVVAILLKVKESGNSLQNFTFYI